MREDPRGNRLSGASAAAMEHYENALEAMLCYRGDPLAHTARALEDSPRFAMAHLLRGHLGIVMTEQDGLKLASEAISAVRALALSPQERLHAAALLSLSAGDWEGGVFLLERLLAEHPRDVLALQVAHLMNFFLGDARNLRDCVGRVRGAWTEDLPGYHAVLGMHAFGLEECGDYNRADLEGRNALDLNPFDGWAHHAVTHVYEMLGDVENGLHWAYTRERFWRPDSFLAVHQSWHLGLFLAETGDLPTVLKVYDEQLRGTKSKLALDLLDATALLWRLDLRGVEVSTRWAELAAAWEPHLGERVSAFNDFHAALALLGAGMEEEFDALLELMEDAAQSGVKVTNARMYREVAIPLCDAFASFKREEYDRAVSGLLKVRPVAHRFGGSHAQRDLIDLTLAEAALDAGEWSLALALSREREELRPRHPSARRIEKRALASAVTLTGVPAH